MYVQGRLAKEGRFSSPSLAFAVGNVSYKNLFCPIMFGCSSKRHSIAVSHGERSIPERAHEQARKICGDEIAKSG